MVYRPFVQPPSPSTPLERGLTRLLRVAILGSEIICLSFAGHLLIGYSLHLIGVYTPTFSILSLSDPFFVILMSLIGFGFGAAIVQSTQTYPSQIQSPRATTGE